MREKQGQTEMAIQYADSALQTNLKQNGFEPVICQQKIMIYLMLLIGLIILLAVLFVSINRKRLKRANLNLASRTMEVMANENLINVIPSSSAPKPVTDNLVVQLDQLLQSKKVYLDPELTLAVLAEKLNTNTTFLSRIFNEQHNIGFNDYTNELRVKELRVKETCRLLIATNDKNTTIDHILSKLGFSSRSAFFNAFKKFTGVTPDVFKRMNPYQN